MAIPDNHSFLSILIVEDNPGDLFLLEEHLRLTRLPVDKLFKATNAATAIEILENNAIDIVLLDLSLPDSSGFNSYSLIEEHASAVSIIVLTGLADTELALETMANGAQDYLIKGEFDERLLAKSIQYSIERNRIRLSLVESNESYRNLFFNNPLPIFIWDLNTLAILEVNEMAQEEYGYTREELLKMSVLDLGDSTYATHFKAFVKDLKASAEIKRSDIWEHIKKNGEVMIHDVSSHKIDYKGTSAVLAINNNITEKIRLEEKLEEEKMMKQKEINEAMIQVQEKERYEISTELHDNVNQQLTVAMMYIASAQQKYADDELLKQSSGFILNAIEEIRKLSQTLVTPLIKHFGLSKAIEGLLDDVTKVNPIQIDLTADSFYEEDIKYEFKLSIFRIVQEQMNNILKHAKASQVFIELYRKNEEIRLKIQDNGIGFDPNQQRKGIGLYSIFSRSELYDGIVDIQSSPGNGCAIDIRFPLTKSLLI
jgi:two-component system, NarL family, sensor histidine kinase UhpB